MLLVLGVDARGRFVEEQQLGVGGERTRDEHPSLLATREPRDRFACSRSGRGPTVAIAARIRSRSPARKRRHGRSCGSRPDATTSRDGGRDAGDQAVALRDVSDAPTVPEVADGVPKISMLPARRGRGRARRVAASTCPIRWRRRPRRPHRARPRDPRRSRRAGRRSRWSRPGRGPQHRGSRRRIRRSRAGLTGSQVGQVGSHDLEVVLALRTRRRDLRSGSSTSVRAPVSCATASAMSGLTSVSK